MEYNKQLINKAKGSLCKICFEHITDSEADNQEFQSSKTSRGGYIFVHSRCWDRNKKEAHIHEK
jgi:hypothetical protein